MRGGIARLSLLLLLALSAKSSAAPWREKNVFKVATNLPARLIDSIMAQGNWNILFQEGPFSEFQRQIAIGNHFALRGDGRQAEFYFQKAGNALDIAYASLRGRFGWPRNPTELKAAALPWGENRETFEDFLLCRLQLQVESMLAAHESGTIKATNLEAVMADTERQLAKPLREKDADIEQMVLLLRDSTALRNLKDIHPALKAERFAALSDRLATSTRNYWNRRINIFRIFENIRYGNTGRAAHLARYIEAKQKDQTDALSLARIYVQLGSYDEAERILTATLDAPENKTAENYGEYLAYSALMQNLKIWRGRSGDAEKLSAATRAFTEELIASGKIPAEELVDLKKAQRNETLRGFIYGYVNVGKCPASTAFSGDTDMEPEWRVRERIFFERCNFAYDAKAWSALLKSNPVNAELQAAAAYHLGENRVKFPSANGASALTAHLVARARLEKIIAKNDRNNLAAALVSYLYTRNAVQPEFTVFDWGIDLRDDLTDRALAAIPANLPEKTGRELFAELHRRFVWNNLKTNDGRFFSPADAAVISKKSGAAILDFPENPAAVPAAQISAGKSLLYSDRENILFSGKAEKKQQYRIWKRNADPAEIRRFITGAQTAFLLHGDAVGIAGGLLPDAATAQIPPFYAYCPECGQSAARIPERMIIAAEKGRLPPAFLNDLADNFSVISDGAARDCPAGGSRYDDSVMLIAATGNPYELPCNTAAEKIVVEYGAALSGSNLNAALSLGWRPNLSLILLPQMLPEQVKTAFLFDFFQRTNRRQVKPADAFRDARTRAEKSFPTGEELAKLHLYESMR
ncbi:MAG: hypothetical protein KF713_10940 [Turneriella sp.]|nr:hypothetical protein [Turneriella sp.]